MIELWLIPVIPLAGFAVNGLLGTRFGKSFVSAVGVGAAALATVAAYSRLIPFLRGDHATVIETYASWIVAGDLTLDLSFRLDPLSALMLSFVTFVAFLIHVYAIGYMHHEATDAGYARFFSYLNLFLFAMLVLVLAENFVLMFVGWEGVGLCSYLLVGYYFDREYAAAAGTKAFVVNRIGDYGFLLGMFGIFTAFGSLNFSEVFGKAAADPTLELAKLQAAFDHTFKALDAMDGFRSAAIAGMARNNEALQALIDKSKPYVERAAQGAAASKVDPALMGPVAL